MGSPRWRCCRCCGTSGSTAALEGLGLRGIGRGTGRRRHADGVASLRERCENTKRCPRPEIRHFTKRVPDGAAVMLLPRQFVFCVTYFEARRVEMQRDARVPRLRPPLRALRHDGSRSRGGSIISARADRRLRRPRSRAGAARRGDGVVNAAAAAAALVFFVIMSVEIYKQFYVGRRGVSTEP